ncbi:hypothetical protein [Mariniphaga sediminis]|uniref:hypothetical protein n=1 Tax=Mariniphaga sediminis TaxID=1628158 RepID=UPI0035653EDC
MPAGFKYSLDPQEVERELCNQETIYRLSGGFNLDDDKLVADIFLPHLAPLAVDFATRKAKAVKNVKIYENANSAATSLKVEKNSLVYVDMYLSNGSKAAKVTAIDKGNTGYDVLTITLGAAVVAGDVLFEAGAASTGGTKGVYTLTISAAPTANDVLTVGGVDYTYAAAESDTAYATGADAKAAAANIEDALSAQYDGIFSVVAKNGKLIFTQLTAGIGDIPVVSVTQTGGTLVAAIVETTAGVAAVDATSPLNVANFLNYARVKVEAGATVTAIGQAFEIKESQLYLPVSAKCKASLGARFMFV